jgi:hypothetical protein
MTTPNARRRMIQKVLSGLRDDDLTAWDDAGNPNPEFVSDLLSFDVSAEELRTFDRRRHGVKAPAKAVAPDKPPPAAAAAVKPVPQPPAEAAIAAAERQVRKAELALDGARAVVVRAQRTVKATRSDLAQALAAWQRGLTPRTPEAVAREQIAANQAYKLAVVNGEIAPPEQPRIGRSAVDVTAHYGHGGSIDGSRGSAFRRGSFPASARGRRIAVR